MTKPIFTKEHVDQAIFHTARVFASLPALALTPADRVILCGYRWRFAKSFIHKTAHTVTTRPQIFSPQERAVIADAAARQLRSHRLRSLGEGLKELASRCADMAEADEGTATRACMDLITTIQGESPSTTQANRLAALRGAINLLERRSSHKNRPQKAARPRARPQRARLLESLLGTLQAVISPAQQ